MKIPALPNDAESSKGQEEQTPRHGVHQTKLKKNSDLISSTDPQSASVRQFPPATMGSFCPVLWRSLMRAKDCSPGLGAPRGPELAKKFG
jgi:hypothetical protein